MSSGEFPEKGWAAVYVVRPKTRLQSGPRGLGLEFTLSK